MDNKSIRSPIRTLPDQETLVPLCPGLVFIGRNKSRGASSGRLPALFGCGGWNDGNGYQYRFNKRYSRSELPHWCRCRAKRKALVYSAVDENGRFNCPDLCMYWFPLFYSTIWKRCCAGKTLANAEPKVDSLVPANLANAALSKENQASVGDVDLSRKMVDKKISADTASPIQSAEQDDNVRQEDVYKKLPRLRHL